MFLKINKMMDLMTSKGMQAIDYIGAIIVLAVAGYKYYNEQPYELLLGVGILALIIAIIRPAKVMKDKLLSNRG